MGQRMNQSNSQISSQKHQAGTVFPSSSRREAAFGSGLTESRRSQDVSASPIPIMLAAACVLTVQSVLAMGQSASPAPSGKELEAKSLQACAQVVAGQLALLKIPEDAQSLRFQGKVSEATALCRGGEQALQFRGTPWVDWANYWGTGDMTSLPTGFLSSKLPAQRGVAGALLDLELQSVELIKFNLFDNSERIPNMCRAERSGRFGSQGLAGDETRRHQPVLRVT